MLSGGGPPRAAAFRVLGVRVDAVQIPEVVAWMLRCIEERRAARFVAVTGMHGVTEARHDPVLSEALAEADLVVPDGMPLVWIGRAHGHPLRRRVYGPELMLTFCRAMAWRGVRHFFYGGAPGVADEVAAALSGRIRGLRVAGTYSPPFRPMTEDEDRMVVRRIEASVADVVWVGLSTPKQEKWMLAHRGLLRVPVMVGVGAAFDLHAGRVPQAPEWMREHGLEWSYRLCKEPRRLWRRYLVRGPEFLWNASLELLRLRNYEA